MILDTTFAIDLFRGSKDAAAKAAELDKRGEPVFATAVTVFELWQGLDARHKEKRERLAHFVETFGMLDLDMESAKRGGEVHSELILKGTRIDPEDSMIAGVALHRAQPLLTRDEHFSRIKGLKIETY